MSEQSKWQPIETAPKDGTRFAAIHKSGVLTMLEITRERFNYHTEQYDDWDCMAVAYRCGASSALSEFTHWMPLPTPPATGD